MLGRSQCQGAYELFVFSLGLESSGAPHTAQNGLPSVSPDIQPLAKEVS